MQNTLATQAEEKAGTSEKILDFLEMTEKDLVYGEKYLK